MAGGRCIDCHDPEHRTFFPYNDGLVWSLSSLGNFMAPKAYPSSQRLGRQLSPPVQSRPQRRRLRMSPPIIKISRLIGINRASRFEDPSRKITRAFWSKSPVPD